MTSWVPSKDSDRKVDDYDKRRGRQLALVTDVPGDEENYVFEAEYVFPDVGVGDGSPVYPAIIAPTFGEVALPSEGDLVVVDETVASFPLCDGIIYSRQDKPDAPSYDVGDRIVGHEPSDSQVRLNADGTIDIEHEDGATISIDSNGNVVVDGAANDVRIVEDGGAEVEVSNGEIILNDGTDGVITDVSVNTTTDTDGHVESVSLDITRENTIQV